jgi:hypothetical protein
MQNTFDIFYGSLQSPLWIESVEGLANAIERMEHISEQEPGEYFVFSTETSSIMAKVQTFSRPPILKRTGQSSPA